MWILIGVCVGLLVLYIIFDQRKKIFKIRKRNPKQKPTVVEKIEKKEENQEKISKNISFSESVVSENQSGKIEQINLEEESKQEYIQPKLPNVRRRSNYDSFIENMSKKSYVKNKSVKQQIKDLSPEMKAVLLSNALGKKVDF